MNLLYTLTAYPPSIGGGQLHQHMLAREMQKTHVVQVVSQWDHHRTDWLLGTTLLAPKKSNDYVTNGIPVHRIGLSYSEKLQMLPYVSVYYPLMTKAVRAIGNVFEHHIDPYASEADLLHNVRIGREPFSFASYQVARRRDIPFVFTPLHHPRWRGWRYATYLNLYKHADMIISLTNAEKETMLELGVAEQKIAVTGMGPVLADAADGSDFLSRFNVDGPLILFLGQHYPYKGYRELLQAAPNLWKKIPEAHFFFIGPSVGSSERYFERISDERIHRLPEASLQDKTNALAACSLLCVPSTQESFGAVYTEAWTFGKPVIGCNIPSVAQVIEHEVDGLLVSQEPNEIAKAICDLLLNTQRAQQMGLAGQEKVRKHYTWKQIATRTEEAYRQALKATAPSS